MIPTKNHWLLHYAIDGFYPFTLKLFDKELRISLNKICSIDPQMIFIYGQICEMPWQTKTFNIGHILIK